MDAAARGKGGEGLCSLMVWRGSCSKAGLGVLPGVSLSLGAVLGDMSMQFVSDTV